MKDFKMAVPECMREEIQKRLSDCGCYDEDINKKDCNFIIVQDMEIYDGHNITNFLCHQSPEITLTEFYQLTEKSESETKIDKIRDLIKQLQELTNDK